MGLSVDDQKFYRLVDDAGEWPVFSEDDGQTLRHAPVVVRLAGEGDRSLFRLIVQARDREHSIVVENESNYVIAVGPEPHFVTEVDCLNISGGGICGTDSHTSVDALECDWSQSLRDYDCTSTRVFADWLAMPHPAARRFTLIGDRPLPVVKLGMERFENLQQLDQRLRSDRALSLRRSRIDPMHPLDTKNDDLVFGERVLVDGIGILQPLDRVQRGVDLYAAPGRDDDMELRLFAFPQNGAPFVVPFHKLVDGHEPLTEEGVAATPEEGAAATPEETRTATAENWSIDVGESFKLGIASVVSLALYDGKARGIFWLAVDDAKPDAMSVLRIASDVGSYDHCDTFLYPASASSFAKVDGHVELMIEPHSRRGDSGELTKNRGEEDPPLPCHVRGTVTWDPAKGFYLMLTDVPCKANETPVGVVIDAHGQLSAAPLRTERND